MKHDALRQAESQLDKAFAAVRKEKEKMPTIEEWKRQMHGMLNGLRSLKEDRNRAEMDLLHAVASLASGMVTKLHCDKVRAALNKYEAASKALADQNEMIREYGRKYYPAKVRLAALEEYTEPE